VNTAEASHDWGREGTGSGEGGLPDYSLQHGRRPPQRYSGLEVVSVLAGVEGLSTFLGFTRGSVWGVQGVDRGRRGGIGDKTQRGRLRIKPKATVGRVRSGLLRSGPPPDSSD
jgi:hypothetical protein